MSICRHPTITYLNIHLLIVVQEYNNFLFVHVFFCCCFIRLSTIDDYITYALCMSMKQRTLPFLFMFFQKKKTFNRIDNLIPNKRPPPPPIVKVIFVLFVCVGGQSFYLPAMRIIEN